MWNLFYNYEHCRYNNYLWNLICAVTCMHVGKLERRIYKDGNYSRLIYDNLWETLIVVVALKRFCMCTLASSQGGFRKPPSLRHWNVCSPFVNNRVPYTYWACHRRCPADMCPLSWLFAVHCCIKAMQSCMPVLQRCVSTNTCNAVHRDLIISYRHGVPVWSQENALKAASWVHSARFVLAVICQQVYELWS